MNPRDFDPRVFNPRDDDVTEFSWGIPRAWARGFWLGPGIDLEKFSPALVNPGIKNPRDYNLWLFTFWLEVSAEWTCVHAELKIPGMRDTCGMPPSVPSNPTVAMALAGDDVMWFLPSAMNVNLKKFTQALVNGGSKCDSLKVVSASSSK